MKLINKQELYDYAMKSLVKHYKLNKYQAHALYMASGKDCIVCEHPLDNKQVIKFIRCSKTINFLNLINTININTSIVPSKIVHRKENIAIIEQQKIHTIEKMKPNQVMPYNKLFHLFYNISLINNKNKLKDAIQPINEYLDSEESAFIPNRFLLKETINTLVLFCIQHDCIFDLIVANMGFDDNGNLLIFDPISDRPSVIKNNLSIPTIN